MDELDTTAMRETMSEVYDRMTTDAAEEEAEREADREFLSSLSEEEFAKESRRRLEAVWEKHHGDGADFAPERQVTEVNAPSHWSSEHKEQFAQLSPTAQRLVLNQVGSIEQELLDQHVSAGSTSTSSGWSDYLQNLGATQEGAFNGLMNLDYTLRYGSPDQKRQTLWQPARDFGVDVLGPSAAQANPAAAVLQEQLRSLSEANQKLSEARRAQQQRTNSQIVEAFRNQTENGQKAHPHFDFVQDDMARLIRAGRARTLGEAYNRAVSMRPGLSAVP